MKTCFLRVNGVPYHSECLNRVTDTVEEDLEDKNYACLQVNNTEDGISLSLPNLGTYRLIFMSMIGSDMRETS